MNGLNAKCAQAPGRAALKRTPAGPSVRYPNPNIPKKDGSAKPTPLVQNMVNVRNRDSTITSSVSGFKKSTGPPQGVPGLASSGGRQLITPRNNISIYSTYEDDIDYSQSLEIGETLISNVIDFIKTALIEIKTFAIQQGTTAAFLYLSYNTVTHTILYRFLPYLPTPSFGFGVPYANIICLGIATAGLAYDYYYNSPILYSPLYDTQAAYADYLKKLFRTFAPTTPIIHNTQNSTHPLAAGIRAHHRSMLTDFLNRNNFKIYEIHRGYHRMYNGYQGMYGPADLSKIPTHTLRYSAPGEQIITGYKDDIHFQEATLILLTDADYYVDMAELMSYHKPIAILTKDTSRISSQSSEMGFGPLTDNYFGYEVAGGGMYKHKSNRYDRDQIISNFDNGVNDTNRQTAYSTERFPLPNNEQIVFLTPLPCIPSNFPITPLIQETVYNSPGQQNVNLQLVYHKENGQYKYTVFAAYPYARKNFRVEWDNALFVAYAARTTQVSLAGTAALLVRTGETDHEKLKYIKDTIIHNMDTIYQRVYIDASRHTGQLDTQYQTLPGHVIRHPGVLPPPPQRYASGGHPFFTYIYHRIHNTLRSYDTLYNIAHFLCNMSAGFFTYQMVTGTYSLINLYNHIRNYWLSTLATPSALIPVNTVPTIVDEVTEAISEVTTDVANWCIDAFNGFGRLLNITFDDDIITPIKKIKVRHPFDPVPGDADYYLSDDEEIHELQDIDMFRNVNYHQAYTASDEPNVDTGYNTTTTTSTTPYTQRAVAKISDYTFTIPLPQSNSFSDYLVRNHISLPPPPPTGPSPVVLPPPLPSPPLPPPIVLATQPPPPSDHTTWLLPTIPTPTPPPTSTHSTDHTTWPLPTISLPTPPTTNTPSTENTVPITQPQRLPKKSKLNIPQPPQHLQPLTTPVHAQPTNVTYPPMPPIIPQHIDLPVSKTSEFQSPSDDSKFKEFATHKYTKKQHQLLSADLLNLETPYHNHFRPDHGYNHENGTDLHDEEYTNTMKPIGPAAYDPSSHVHGYTASNNSSLDAIHQRIELVNTEDPSDFQNNLAVLKTIKNFFNILFGDTKLLPLEIEELDDHMKTSNQKKRLKDYNESVSSSIDYNMFAHNNAFIKAEIADKEYGAQRNISNVCDPMFVQASRYVIPSVKLFKQKVRGYVFQYDAATVGTLIHETFNSFDKVVATDYSKFDGTQGCCTKAIEKFFYITTFEKPLPMLDILDAESEITFRASPDITYNPNYTRLSGSAETSFGNSLVNFTIAAISYLYSVRQISYDNIISDFTPTEINAAVNRVIVGGDDGLACDMNIPYYQELVNRFKLKIELQECNTTDPVNMLSLIYPNAKVSPCAGPDLNRLLPKLAYGTTLTQHSPISQLSAKIQGYFVTFSGNNPIVNDLFNSLKRIYSKYLVEVKPDSKDLPFTHFMGQPIPIDECLLSIYAAHISFGTQQMLDIINSCNELDELNEQVNMLHSLVPHKKTTIKPDNITQLGRKKYYMTPSYLSHIQTKPDIFKMMPFKTTIDAVVSITKQINPLDYEFVDLTVGSGCMASMILSGFPTNVQDKVELHTQYYDKDEYDFFCQHLDHPPVLDTATTNFTRKTTQKKLFFIIDPPFDAMKTSLDAQTIIYDMLKQVSFDPLNDLFIINCMQRTHVSVIKFLNDGVLKSQNANIQPKQATPHTSGGSAVIITNAIYTAPGAVRKINFNLTNNKASKSKNLEVNTALIGDYPLNTAEASILSTPQNPVAPASYSTLLKERSYHAAQPRKGR